MILPNDIISKQSIVSRRILRTICSFSSSVSMSAIQKKKSIWVWQAILLLCSIHTIHELKELVWVIHLLDLYAFKSRWWVFCLSRARLSTLFQHTLVWSGSSHSCEFPDSVIALKSLTISIGEGSCRVSHVYQPWAYTLLECAKRKNAHLNIVE